MPDEEWKGQRAIYYTTAPANYDGFGTYTIWDRVGRDGDRTFRMVSIEARDRNWQLGRYGSGMYVALTPAEFQDLVRRKLAQKLGDPTLAGLRDADRARILKDHFGIEDLAQLEASREALELDPRRLVKALDAAWAAGRASRDVC